MNGQEIAWSIFGILAILTCPPAADSFMRWVYREAGIPYPKEGRRKLKITGSAEVDGKIIKGINGLADRLDRKADHLLQKAGLPPQNDESIS